MRQDIEFKSEGVTCRGWLFTPDAGKPPFPCVVTAGGGSYVKEFPIMLGHAEEFMHHGLASILFDYRHYGASEGLPRQHIDFWEQVEDCRNAISLAETLPNVDPERLGFWGISLGGAHAFIVPAVDPRVKCTVSTVPGVDSYTNNRLVRGEEQFEKFRELILEDRRKRFKDETHWGYIPSFSAEPEKELSRWAAKGNYEVFMNIKKVAPAWENRSTIASSESMMNFQNVWSYLPRLIGIPILVIVVEKDTNTPWDVTIEAYNRIPSPNPHKKLVIIPSEGGKVTHLSLYSEPSHMQKVAKEAAKFLAEHLVEPYKK